MDNYTGFTSDAILLSIGRAILRKQTRDKRTISDFEAMGHAMVIQGRYGFVPNDLQQQFCNDVVRAFRFVEQREVSSISKVAYLSFQKDELLGNSVLDSQLATDLQNLGYQ
ncbi:hypothetical protein [Pseudomonas bharatica]|uniref:hypothetical protein n=1 Tax=Pseudomonas bharatica TaxID=2692112 RepID=UPI003B283CCA